MCLSINLLQSLRIRHSQETNTIAAGMNGRIAIE